MYCSCLFVNTQTVFVPAIVFSIHIPIDNCFGVDDDDDDDNDATDLPATRYPLQPRFKMTKKKKFAWKTKLKENRKQVPRCQS